ncbi:MAG: FecR domain-containing protein [Myxococcaceae bacterium]|nr:FecR domain-containing protein [Myxococcaceae bacterium]
MSPAAPRRSRGPFLLGIAGIVLFGATATYLMFLSEPPPAPRPANVRPAVVAAPKPQQLTLSQLSGAVEVKGADGTWRAAKAGDVLKPSDGVRTQDGAYAVIVGGEYWEVKMEPGTEVEVGELSESISRLLLGSGMAHATVRKGNKHTFEVKAKKGDAAARSAGGAFTIAGNGEGTVAVSTEDGETELEGKGRVVIVRAGQRSVVLPGQAPTDPVAVPSSLLLKVSLPPVSLVNKTKLTVVGQTEPGARVQIGGRMIETDATGRFSTTVKLDEGKQEIDVKAVGVGGVNASSAHQIELDTHVRRVTIDKNLWK